jgi:cation diffusion facilitator family transporter
MAGSREQRNAEKIRWARISVWSNVTLTVMKLAVGLVMFSVSVLSEAIHSGMDILAAIIASFGVIISARPPDREHAYGHGKYENLSAVAEAALIFVAAAVIIIESVERILYPSEVGQLDLGIFVMGISALVNLAVGRRMGKVARQTDSAALEADALHHNTDVWTSAGVLGGLVLIRVTGWQILDPAIAIVVALATVQAAWVLVSKSARDLADANLPEEELEKIKRIVARHRDKYVEFHGLRARRSGAQRHIDLHLVLARDTHVDQAHELCDLIETEIEGGLDGSEVLVHIEPCAHECDDCATRPTCKAAAEDSLSGGLAERDWKAIDKVMEEHRGEYADFRDVRMRKDGRLRRLDLKLLVARHTSLDRAHDLAASVTSGLQQRLPGTAVHAELEPCRVNCSACEKIGTCNARGRA